MTKRFLSLTVAALLLVAGACAGEEDDSGSGGSAGTVPAPSLTGRTFLSTAVSGHTLVDGTRIRLTFDEGTLGASAGCNSMSGTLEIEDGRLVVAQMAGTEMGCDPALHDQDQWLSDFLTARPSYELAGDELRLTGGGATVTLLDREQADPDRPLQGTTWKLDGLIEGDSVSSVPQGSGATLTFSDGRVGVKIEGCNEAGGTVLVADDTVTFDALETTLMKCEGAAAQVEEHVMGVLRGEVAYEIEAGSLTLNHPSGTGLMLRAS